MKTIIDRIKPVLDFINPELLEPDKPPWPDTIVERCKSVLKIFKQYAHGVACSTGGHALAVVRSVYPSVNLEVIDGGYGQELSDEQITALEEEVLELVIKLADDLELLGDAGNES